MSIKAMAMIEPFPCSSARPVQAALTPTAFERVHVRPAPWNGGLHAARLSRFVAVANHIKTAFGMLYTPPLRLGAGGEVVPK